jgi:hypothetical protein
VKGVAEVYGRDEDEFDGAQQQLTSTSSNGAQVWPLTGRAVYDRVCGYRPNYASMMCWPGCIWIHAAAADQPRP